MGFGGYKLPGWTVTDHIYSDRGGLMVSESERQVQSVEVVEEIRWDCKGGGKRWA